MLDVIGYTHVLHITWLILRVYKYTINVMDCIFIGDMYNVILSVCTSLVLIDVLGYKALSYNAVVVNIEYSAGLLNTFGLKQEDQHFADNSFKAYSGIFFALKCNL